MVDERPPTPQDERPNGAPAPFAGDPTGVVLTEEQIRRRRGRNVAIAVLLFLLVALFYVLTVFRMGGDVANRTM